MANDPLPPPPRILADLALLFSGILLDTATKSTALLLLTCAAAILARRASAATRHLLWAATLASLLLLPLLSWTLPAWHILPLPSWARLDPAASSTAPSIPLAPTPAFTPPLFTTPPLSDPSSPPLLPPTISTTPPLTPALSPPPQAPRVSAPLETRNPKLETPPLTPAQLLLRLYATGTALLLLPLLLSFLYLRHLARRAAPLPEPWPTLLQTLQSLLSLRRPISLKQSARRTVPMTFGILRPTILLPKNAWPDQCRQIVLLHELAHIRRHDCLTQLLARLVRALFWFHPLVWLAAARLALEAERACDDLVLSAGTRSSDYASELLSLASSFHPPHPALATSALTMARPSTLETRLRAILDATRNRCSLTRNTVFAACILALALLVPLACIKSTTSSASAKTSPPVLVMVTWHADPAGQFSPNDTRTLTLTDPDILQKLAASFPAMGQSRHSDFAGGWKSAADFHFTCADGSSLHIATDPQLTHWSEGHGDWPVQGNLAAQLAALPWPQPAGNIAWGPAIQGIQLGIRVPQPRYAFGDPLAPELWARNLTDQPLTWQYFETPSWTTDIFSPHADGAGDIAFRSSGARVTMGNPVPTIIPLPPHQETKLRTLPPVTLVDLTQPSSGRMNLLAAAGKHALSADWSQELTPGPSLRWNTGKTEIEIAAPPVIAATQTDLLPEVGVNYTLFPNDIYKSNVPGPAERDNSKAWTMANEFVYRTALRKRYKLPASSSGRQGDGYVVGFDAADGTGTLHVLVSQDFTRVSSQGEWGNMIDGVQAQLVATGSGPETRLTAAVRNDGMRTLLEMGETQRACELQVEGQWYRWDAATAGGKLLPFGSGIHLENIAVTLEGQWKKKEEGEPYALWGSGFATTANAEPLTLTPGKHTVRIAFFALPSRANSGNMVRAQSNLVEVQTGPTAASRPAATAPTTTAAAEASWGDPVNGVQLRLAPGRSIWSVKDIGIRKAEAGVSLFAEKEPALKVEVRNLTEKPMSINLDFFALECDGKVYHPQVGTRTATTEVKPKGTAVIDLPLAAFVMPPLDGSIHKVPRHSSG